MVKVKVKIARVYIYIKKKTNIANMIKTHRNNIIYEKGYRL